MPFEELQKRNWFQSLKFEMESKLAIVKKEMQSEFELLKAEIVALKKENPKKQ